MSMFLILPPVMISATEYARLAEIATRARQRQGIGQVADTLLYELSRAHVLPADAVMRDIVGMHCTFEHQDVETSVTSRNFLAYPGEEHLYLGAVSVLSPLGTAAIGMRSGSSIPWKTTSGQNRALGVLRGLEPRHADWQQASRLFRSVH